jgi:threonyl-tRNA synthetase
VFCRTSQVEEEALKVWDIIDRFYSTFGFTLNVRFSTHDPANMDSYSGSQENWESTEAQLLAIMKNKVGDNFIDGIGEAAFYGPKIDFIAKDALGREYQVATIQLDFNQPEGFDLHCINEQGERERIVMIHAAVMGSIERFLSVYIEHIAGRFPVWLAPEQLRIITLNQDQNILDFAYTLLEEAKKVGVRATIDDNNESVSKKIRSAELMKIPYTVVVGPKEVESGEITQRIPPRTPYELVKTLSNEAKMRVNKTSL